MVLVVIAALGRLGVNTTSFAAVLAAAGVSGTVQEVEIFTTVLHTPDNRRVVVPNGDIVSVPVINVHIPFPQRDVHLKGGEAKAA